jgi:hypothetical protein
MTIALRATGATSIATVAVTAVNPVIPAGVQASDLCVLTVSAKPYNTYIATPLGWTKIGEATNGTTPTGGSADTGSTKVAVFVLTGQTSSYAIGSIVQANADSMNAVINVYSTDGAGWDISSFTTGGDNVNDANYSTTGAAWPFSVDAGDWVVASAAINGDIGASSAHAMGGMAGATLGTLVGRVNFDTTTGTDTNLLVYDAPVTAGSSTAAPTFTYTNASNTSGTTLWFRLRSPAPTITDTGVVKVINGSDSYTNTSPIVVIKPAGTADGDLLLLGINLRGTRTITSPASGWTLLSGHPPTPTTDPSINWYVYWKVASSEGASWSFTASAADYASFSCVALRYVDTTTPINAFTVAAVVGSIGSPDVIAPTVTPSVITNGLLVNLFASRNDQGATWPGQWTYPPPAVVPGTDVSQARASSLITTLQLASASATGTKTASILPSNVSSSAATSVVVAPISGPAPLSAAAALAGVATLAATATVTRVPVSADAALAQTATLAATATAFHVPLATAALASTATLTATAAWTREGQTALAATATLTATATVLSPISAAAALSSTATLTAAASTITPVTSDAAMMSVAAFTASLGLNVTSSFSPDFQGSHGFWEYAVTSGFANVTNKTRLELTPSGDVAQTTSTRTLIDSSFSWRNQTYLPGADLIAELRDTQLVSVRVNTMQFYRPAGGDWQMRLNGVSQGSFTTDLGHKNPYFRLRHDAAADTLNWDIGPDGKTWWTQVSIPRGAWAATSLYARFETGTGPTETWDNWRVQEVNGAPAPNIVDPTIRYRGAGPHTSPSAAVTALAPVTSDDLLPSDMSILTAQVKGSAAGVAPVVSTPAGWTLIGSANNGTLVAGTDTGSNTVAMFYRIGAPASTSVPLTITGADSGGAVITSYATDKGLWETPVITTGSDVGFNDLVVAGAGTASGASPVTGSLGPGPGHSALRVATDVTAGTHSGTLVADEVVRLTYYASAANSTLTITPGPGTSKVMFVRVRDVAPDARLATVAMFIGTLSTLRTIAAALTATTTLSATATVNVSQTVTAALGAVATMSATATVTRADVNTAAALNTSAALSATAEVTRVDVTVAAALAATATLSAAADVTRADVTATAALATVATLTAAVTVDTPIPVQEVTGALTTVATLASTATGVRPVTAALATSAAFAATADVTRPLTIVTAALAANSTLHATAAVTQPMTAALDASFTSSAAAVAFLPGTASGDLDITLDLTADVTLAQPAAAALQSVVTFAATADVLHPILVAAELEAIATLTATAVVIDGVVDPTLPSRYDVYVSDRDWDVVLEDQPSEFAVTVLRGALDVTVG